MKTNITLEEAMERATGRLRRKMEYSISLLRKAERIAQSYDKENGFYLAFSGGKDSQALFHITELAGVKFQAHMSLTSVDPPDVIRFVKRNYPEVELIAPKKSIYAVAVEKQILPTMRVRWCCNEYKEGAGAGKVTLIGIRHEESSRRKARKEVEISSKKFSGTLEGLDVYRAEQKKKTHSKETNITNAEEESTAGCIHGKESLLISPIIHWTERDVWEFLNDVMQVVHCNLYDEGYRRIGCIGCPMANLKQKQRENQRWPHVKRNWIKAIIAIRTGGGIRKNSYQKNIWNPSGTALVKNGHPSTAGKSDAGYILHPDPSHWGGARKQRIMEGFSECSSSDGLTDEQEREIAENIYDWWISGMSYKKWYAKKFLQYQFNFSDKEYEKE